MKLNLNELRKVLKLNDTATVEECYVEIGRLQGIYKKTPAPWKWKCDSCKKWIPYGEEHWCFVWKK